MEIVITVFVILGIFLVAGFVYIKNNKKEFEKAKVNKNYRKKKRSPKKKSRG